jgi:exopolyphosphatase / guanosine-5'-triphosphate,3'-diphosphate pyrophosphatase
MKKIAVIDLGTNGFRLYIAETLHKGQFHVIHKESNDLKLASEGIHHIGQAPFERGLAAMRHFSTVLKKYDVHKIQAFGTAALRIADNGQDFMNIVTEETGIEIELITGSREAELIYLGMRMGIPTEKSGLALSIEPVVMIDVGGGSVEFIICNTEGVLWAHSFNIGVAILKQQFHIHDPIIETEIRNIESFLDEAASDFLHKIEEFKPKIPIIACGTIDFMVKILKGGYEKPYLEIEKLTYDSFYNQWINLSENDLYQQPNIPKDKVEMLAVSLILMDWVLKKMNSSKLIASANSMKSGILYEMSL